MYAYEIDSDGFIINNYLIDGDVPVPEDVITVQLPQPLLFHNVKWNGREWIEGESEADRTEREAVQQLETFLPSADEITNAELEIKMIALLTELEVI